MRAVAGDELLEDGAAPYLVRWKDGHESVFMPSSDTLVEHRLADQQES